MPTGQAGNKKLMLPVGDTILPPRPSSVKTEPPKNFFLGVVCDRGIRGASPNKRIMAIHYALLALDVFSE